MNHYTTFAIAGEHGKTPGSHYRHNHQYKIYREVADAICLAKIDIARDYQNICQYGDYGHGVLAEQNEIEKRVSNGYRPVLGPVWAVGGKAPAWLQILAASGGQRNQRTRHCTEAALGSDRHRALRIAPVINGRACQQGDPR